jgi:ABC-2 type transport system ATP-binding protein
VIVIERLSKWYGRTEALAEITFNVEAGDTFGLIGPNGAGKTTLMRILATVLAPSMGRVTIDGHRVTPNAVEVRRAIGYLPDYVGVYEDMQVKEYLEFFAAAYGLGVAQRRTTIEGVLQLTDLTSKRSALIGTLSRGMQQRLGLARVLVHDPKVLLLDEPASGLDPRARIEIRELLKELQRMGKTILISSHILQDIASICNKIGLIEKGRLLYAGRIVEAMARVQSDRVWIVEVLEGPEPAAKLLGAQPCVAGTEIRDHQLVVTLTDQTQDPSVIPRLLMDSALHLQLFKRVEPTLEDAFLKLTKGIVS